MLFLTRVRPRGELALLRTYVPPVLPDGLFSNQKIPIWVNILEGLSLENVYIYIYVMVIWNILRPFGILVTIWYICVHSEHFFRF
jgi:hypothetical protein